MFTELTEAKKSQLAKIEKLRKQILILSLTLSAVSLLTSFVNPKFSMSVGVVNYAVIGLNVKVRKDEKQVKESLRAIKQVSN
jgi:hypothetical protein